MRLVKKLDIFILRQFLLLFTGTFCISLFVLMMQFLWRYVDDLIGKGLTMDVLAQFFWYMALMLVPQALPLAVLLSSLITMGNLGESSELTAIKAAGVSLLKSTRAMIVFACIVAGCSFVFQNDIGPNANVKLGQLLLSMRQKSPELEIPEGIFYSGIPNCNLYVQSKDMETGKLYGVMIYRMTTSYEDAAIILADSGMMQSTADKQHLKLTLYSGEWFENLRSQELGGQANVPYRRETFIEKVIVLDFDSGFNMSEASGLASQAKALGLSGLRTHLDSLRLVMDSVGTGLKSDMERLYVYRPKVSKADSLRSLKRAADGTVNADSIYTKLPVEKQRSVMQEANSRVHSMTMDLEFRGYMSADMHENERQYIIEMVNKFTLSLTCVIFVFIGLSLGAIIRKGGLGVPVIISVLVFIIFYVLDNTGYRMARQASWTITFGKGLAPGVLIPLAVFITYKANKDSVVFNVEAYRSFFVRLFGIRLKRNIASKEVIINDPDYQRDAQRLQELTGKIQAYSQQHSLRTPPNPIKVFFQYQDDHDVEHFADELEQVINDLGNTRDRFVLSYLNRYPVLQENAHTRPFNRKWMNVTAGIIFPVGTLLYIRMCRFRFRLLKDLKQIVKVNALMTARINDMQKAEQ